MGAGKDPAREAFKIEARNAVPEPNEPVTLEEVHSLLREEMADETAMTLLKGFKLDFSGTGNFHKVFFSVKCDCGTAGLLSVEVAKSKTPSQLKVALPGLVQHLKSKAGQFSSMSCEMHARMSRGGPPVAPSESGRPPAT